MTAKEYCYLIEDVFPENVVAGFTKPLLPGDLPVDIQQALAFLEKDLKFTYLNQKHSSQVNVVDMPGLYDGDALFTAAKNNVLVVRTADCLPVLFYSDELGVVGVVHMGWRSAKSGILDNIPYDLRTFKVILGPGLRKCCYQVGEKFYQYDYLSDYVYKSNEGVCFDPVAFCRARLSDLGVNSDNIYDLNLCSFCFPIKLFSYRRDKTSQRTLSFVLQTDTCGLKC